MVIVKKPTIKPLARLNKDESALFDKVALEALDEGKRRIFDALTPHEQRTVLSWLSTAIIDGNPNNSIYDILWETDFVRKPVDVEKFLTDEYYFGRSCKDLHPRWMDDLKKVLAINSPYMEWLMTGSIGTGKTTVACAAMGYKQYLMSCMRNPASYYGLLPDSMLVFGIYSITKRQVNDSGYFKLRSYIDSSAYFRNEYPRLLKIDSKIVYTRNNVQVVTGSSNLHAIGLDLFSFLMDEVNFMKAKNDPETAKLTGQAYDLYNATYTRLLSRFMRPGGTVPGIMLLLSSRNAQTSFLEERIKTARSNKHTFISDYRLWEVKPAHRFVFPQFKVEIGDRIAKSHVLRSPVVSIIQRAADKTINAETARKEAALVKPEQEEKPRRHAQVISVPGEFLGRFQEDTDQALRDIAGVATFNLSPLIRDRQSIYDAFKPNLKHPFTRESIVLDIADPATIDQFFKLRELCRIENSKWVPKYNPNAPRFIHIDLSINGDCAGLAMSHLAGMKRVKRDNPMDGITTIIESPYAMVDLMLQIRPPPGSEIDLEKIRSFVGYLAKIFPVMGVTYDGFQSVDSVQMLKKAGFDAAVQSVDVREDPYLALRSAHFERRLAMYHYQPYEDEVLDLQRDATTRKVDHPTRSSKGGKGAKDVSDAVCGSVYGALNHKASVVIARQVEIEDNVKPQEVPLGEGDTPAPTPELVLAGTTGAPAAPSNFPGAPKTARPDQVRSEWDALTANVNG